MSDFRFDPTREECHILGLILCVGGGGVGVSHLRSDTCSGGFDILGLNLQWVPHPAGGGGVLHRFNPKGGGEALLGSSPGSSTCKVRLGTRGHTQERPTEPNI